MSFFSLSSCLDDDAAWAALHPGFIKNSHNSRINANSKFLICLTFSRNFLCSKSIYQMLPAVARGAGNIPFNFPMTNDLSSMMYNLRSDTPGGYFLPSAPFFQFNPFGGGGASPGTLRDWRLLRKSHKNLFNSCNRNDGFRLSAAAPLFCERQQQDLIEQ